MPNKEYIQTIKHREKISNSKKGTIFSKEHRNKMSESHKGKPLSKETRENISKANKGRVFSKEHKKKLSESSKGKKKSKQHIKNMIKAVTGIKKPGVSEKLTGRKLTQEHKEKIRKNLPRGNKHHAWKGGITPKHILIRNGIEIKEWRKKVFERDDYTCKECGIRSGNGKKVYLEAHHIKRFSEFPELRFDTNNGITLCNTCHNPKRGIKKSGDNIVYS